MRRKIKMFRSIIENARLKESAKNQKLKTWLLVTALALGVVGSAIVLTQPVAAQENGEYPLIIQKLVERFGLDAGEVREVFEEHREERQAEHQARFEERLNEAVAEGEITEAQKEAILAKKEEMLQKREEWRNLSQEERHEAMNQHREEMKTWAEENGIDFKDFCAGFGGRGGHFGPKFGGW